MKKFKRGDEVEIMSKEEGFDGSYYEAVVISEIGNEGSKYIVQYRTLQTDDKRVYRGGPLREFRSHDEIRPSPPPPPPQLVASDLEITQRVDAYYNDGWWVGTLRAVNGSECVVYFSNTRELIDFEIDDLRIHHEWVDDQWVVPRKAQRGRPRKR